MSKYSILFEADRFEEIGPFRFPIFEDLTPGEAKGSEIINKKQAKSTYKSMRLAQKIAKTEKITLKAAIDVLSTLGDDAHQDLFFKYSEDVEALNEDSLTPTEQKISFVTLFMRFRGETKLPPSSSWTRTKDWEDADTESMPSKILNEVFELFIKERDGWPAEGNAPEETKPPAKK
jgi:hypothetical protein